MTSSLGSWGIMHPGMDTIFAEAKRVYGDLSEKMEAKVRENKRTDVERKESVDRQFKTHYLKDAGSIKYLEPMLFPKLAALAGSLWLPDHYLKCLEALKRFGCVVYEFYEDPTQAKYNSKAWVGDDKNIYVFSFLCRVNMWFVNCKLSIHNQYAGGIFEVEFLFNALSEKRVYHSCDLFGRSEPISNGEELFEMANNYPSYEEYKIAKWGYLQTLKARVSAEYKVVGFDEEYNFRPISFYLSLLIDDKEFYMTYDVDRKAFNSYFKSNHLGCIPYTGDGDYGTLVKEVGGYIKYVKNEYGCLVDGIYYNDKQFVKLFQDISSGVQFAHPECSKFDNGRIEFEQCIMNGVSLEKKIYCDLSVSVVLGRVIKTKTDVMRCGGFNYERYCFNVKVYENIDSNIIAEFTVVQYNSTTSEPKNKLTIKGTYAEIYHKVRTSISEIYSIYNMPIRLK
ncbi:MAG: hypothetical protein Hyperionvirus7_20 [Hyperionvirus sp.]|uniref:Uncharacterized protein n=1 Tax=Hyperionvirus sp. TaxID=2487770 RepID=A0A3G5ADK3_9VIRU|nr:MAG: hypothetical protein Hyperionvirus7_20 [Hyperionvirus sp.]